MSETHDTTEDALMAWFLEALLAEIDRTSPTAARVGTATAAAVTDAETGSTEMKEVAR